MNNATFKHPKFKIKILANILLPLFTPVYAHADDVVASVTDGTNMSISGKYNTSKKATHALTASGTNSTLTSNGEVSVTTSGSAAYGAYIYKDGSLSLTNSTINTSGGAANGIVLSNGSAQITGGSIATSGSSSTAVRINNGSHLDIDGTTISTKQASSSGIDASGHSQVTLNNSNIVIDGGGLPGINLKDQGTTLKGENNHITLNAYSDGIDLNTGTRADLQDTTINMNGGLSAIRSDANTSLTMKNLIINGSTAHALHIADSALIEGGAINLTQGATAIAMGSADKYANLVLNNVNATSKSRASSMIDANNYAKITLNGGSYLLQSDNDTGAYIAGNTSTLEANNTSITTEGRQSAAIENHGVTNIKDSSVLTKGNNAYALYSEGVLNAIDTKVETNGYSSAAISAARGGIINVKNSTIKTTNNLGHILLNFNGSTINVDGTTGESSGQNAFGVYALGGSTTTILNSHLTMTGQGSGGIYTQGTNPQATAITLDNSTLQPLSGPGIRAIGAKVNVNLKNGSTLRSGNHVLATADSDSNNDSLVNITAEGESTLEGDLIAAENNQLNLSLSDQSIWSGGAHNAGDIEISPDSQWVLTSDSDTNTLNMNGILNMSSSQEGYHTLTVRDSLQGNGEFAMRAAMAEQKGDLLVTQHNTHGQFGLNIKNDGGQKTNGSEQLTMVKTADAGGNFRLSHEVEQGGYLYGLRQASNPNNWELYSLGEIPTPEKPAEPGGDKPTPEKPAEPGGDKPTPEKPAEPGGDKPTPEKPAEPGGDKPTPEKPAEPGGDKPTPEKPAEPGGDKPTPEKPAEPGGDKPTPEKPAEPGGDKPAPEKPAEPGGDKPTPEKPAEPGGDKPTPEKPAEPGGDKPTPEKPAEPGGDKPTPEKPAEPGGDKPTPEKPAEPGGDKPAPEKPAEPGGDKPTPEKPAEPGGDKPAPEKPAEPGGDKPTPEKPSTPSKPPAGHGALTSTAKAAASFANTTYLMNYAETQTLMQRMGELRGNDKSVGLWARGFVGRFDNFSNGKLSGFSMNYHGFQFGADKKFQLQDGVMYFGTFMGLGNSSQTYQDGDGSLKSTSVGLYSTYLTPNGFYVDTLLKYSNMRNRFSVQDTANQQVRGKDSVNGFAASVESGKRFYFSEKRSGFYVEPQAQLSLSYQSSEAIHASNNLRINIDSYNSTLGRASLVAGYNVSHGDMPTNIYIKSGYIREFSGKIDYRLNGSSEQYSNKGGGWNNAIGISTEIKKRHSVYIDFDSTSGGKFDQRQFNAGYRYSF